MRKIKLLVTFRSVVYEGIEQKGKVLNTLCVYFSIVKDRRCKQTWGAAKDASGTRSAFLGSLWAGIKIEKWITMNFQNSNKNKIPQNQEIPGGGKVFEKILQDLMQTI